MSSSWTSRLSKVQASLATPSEEEPIGHLTLAELKQTPMNFGKAHVGKTYEGIWQTNPAWIIKRFLAHYAASSKLDHRKMIKFIQLNGVPPALCEEPPTCTGSSPQEHAPGEPEADHDAECPERTDPCALGHPRDASCRMERSVEQLNADDGQSHWVLQAGPYKEAWDKIHAARWNMLSQVAICLALCRHQHRCDQHAHWEQPKGSLMMNLPYIQEIYRYMVAAKPDLCTAGDFMDPTTKLPIKKGLQITTTSKSMFQAIDNLKCPATHVHQVIEGSTKLHGVSISTSQFSERYPRKFARLIAKTVLKKRFPSEKPLGAIADPVLAMFDMLSAEANANAARERPAKRLKNRLPTEESKMP
eukprot:s3076_g8.t1